MLGASPDGVRLGGAGRLCGPSMWFEADRVPTHPGSAINLTGQGAMIVAHAREE
jgi:hypothetical protein